MFTLAPIVIGTLFLSWVLVGLVRNLAVSRGWVAAPRKDRWHEKPTALHGGIGIVLSFLAGTLVLYGVARFYPQLLSGYYTGWGLPEPRVMGVLVAGALLMALTGWIDDCWNLKPGLKLLLELGAVTMIISVVGAFEITPLPWLNILISYFWFAGIINAVNLLDNMDGVSSGVVIIGLLGLSLTGWFGVGDIPFGALWAMVAAASVLGFWFHNRPPAKIFMGDSGSLFLGFVFALLVIPSGLNGYYGLNDAGGDGMMVRFLIGISLAAIPILDTSLVTITRLMRGQSPSVGGRDHTTHRLAFSGLTDWQTLRVLYGLSAFCAGLALFMNRFPEMGLVAFLVAFVGLGTVAVYIASVQIQVNPIRKEGWQQLLTSFIYRVPLIKMLVDVTLIGVSLYVAYLLRFDFALEDSIRDAVIRSLPVVIVSCLGVNLLLRIYKFSWRLASSRDIPNYAAVAALGIIVSIAFLTLLDRFSPGYSRGAFVIFGGIYFLALATSRFSFRFLDDILIRFRMGQAQSGKIPLLIFGTGREARWLLDEIQHDVERWGNFAVVGIVHEGMGNPPAQIVGVPVRDTHYWSEFQFESQPELIVAGDTIENSIVLAFARTVAQDMRIRRYARKVVDVTS